MDTCLFVRLFVWCRFVLFQLFLALLDVLLDRSDRRVQLRKLLGVRVLDLRHVKACTTEIRLHNECAYV